MCPYKSNKFEGTGERNMPTYTLVIEALGVFNTDAPTLEVWADGVLNTSYTLTSSGSTYTLVVSYAGALPTSLSFKFNDGLGEGGRTIEVQSIKINDRYVNTNNFLDVDTVSHGASVTVNVPEMAFIFDSSEPAASEFSPATDVMTGGNDSFRTGDSNDHIIDALGGNDTIRLGSGDDKLTGNAGNDRLYAGDGDDLVFGDTGNDRINGEGGADTLFGGDGHDRVHGGAGDDHIHGGEGNDRLNGHDDNDIITGGNGNDVIHGGNGTDYLFGDAGDDQMVGGSGNDTLDGGADNDLLYGGGGNDYLDGGTGDDYLIGDTGDDILNGGEGNDTLVGRDDNDELHGGKGDDNLYGGNGNDTLYASLGSATVSQITVADILAANPNLTYDAGTGNFYEYVNNGAGSTNYAQAVAAAAAYTINGESAHLATIMSAAEDAVVGSIVDTGYGWIGLDDAAVEGTFIWNTGPENGSGVGGYSDWYNGTGQNSAASDYVMFLGDSWSDTWYVWAATSNAYGYVAEWEGSNILAPGSFEGWDSSAEINILSGGAGDDTLYGSMGNDTLYGDADNDTIYGNDGDDLIFGGAGNDTIDGGEGTDTINFIGSTGAVIASLDAGTASGEGNDTISDIENIIGSDHADTLTGDENDNVISGGDGNDTINGGAGNDTISGGNQNDTITSGAGNDTITGGDGNDILGSTTLTAGVTAADILAANPDLIYDAGTGNFYEYVSGNITYANAVTAVAANTINGVAGHLATIMSAAEDTVVGSIVNGSDYGWIGLDDTAVEGTHRWNTGPENGQDTSGWSDWYNSNSASADHVLFLGDNWADRWYHYAGTNNAKGYVAEWEGSAVLANNANLSADTVSLSGGDGLDTLYGGAGIDTFIFEAASAFNDADVINNFVTGAGGDAIDISDLLTGFAGPITNWVNFVDSGANTLVQVDSNGTTGGTAWTTIGQINDLTGLDEATLYSDGNIIA